MHRPNDRGCDDSVLRQQTVVVTVTVYPAREPTSRRIACRPQGCTRGDPFGSNDRYYYPLTFAISDRDMHRSKQGRNATKLKIARQY